MYIFQEEFFWKENTGFSILVPEGAEIKRVIVRLRSHWYADSHESSAVPVASCKFGEYCEISPLKLGRPYFLITTQGITGTVR